MVWKEAHAQVFMPRGGSDKKMRALFTSRFVRMLVARLEGIDDADLFPDDRGHRNTIGSGTLQGCARLCYTTVWNFPVKAYSSW